MSDATWLSEAVVEFLKGPMYINPLMSFIDEWCLIFTPEEENKLEYTTCHNMFKELVDKLLTDFLAELGVGPEEFFKVVAAAQETDQLTSFVVQTILTVDDFLMFKAMMVRRNIDLTSQVLDAVAQAFAGGAADGEGDSIASKLTAEEEQALREALEVSNRLHAEWAEVDRLQRAMRALQLEDEDVALPEAIARSLREHAKFDTELAEIEQAIALSLALEEERKRMASQGGAGAAVGAGAAAGAKAGAAGAAAGAGAKPAAAAGAAGAAKPAAGQVSVKDLPPVKAPLAGSAAPPPAAAAAPAAVAGAPDAASPARPSKFVPAEINAPTGASHGGARGRAAGYRSDGSGVDLEAVRKAAQQAAESQKKLIGKGDANDEASKWLQEAKKKLVAQKQADREQELEAYKASAKPVKSAGAAAPSADEAKRAALREALAQKMKQSILQKA